MDPFTLSRIEFDAVRELLAGFCGTSVGKSLALRIGPSRNPAVIAHWLTQVAQMARAIREVSLPPLAGLADASAACKRTTPGGGAGGEDFAAIVSTLEALANVRGFLLGASEELTTLHELAADIGEFGAEIDAIRAVVGPDGKVLDDASERLASLRRQIAQTSAKIREVIYGYLREPEAAKLLQNVTVALHEDRYVLPVKVEYRGRLPGVVHRSSNSGATVFVEPNASVELNNRLADLYDDERREVGRLLSELSLRIYPRSVQIMSSINAAAHVDMVSAKAQYASRFDMTCPCVTEQGPLEFSQARHPLLIEQAFRQEQQGAAPEDRLKVVPIDVRLGQDFDLLVVTGSNTGGKTVTLKTVALLAVMAQSGMYIPVMRGATMPAFRDVFIDVGDEQSLQQSLSTFGAHVKRIRFILLRANPRSLVLLDELGAGTDPDEGGAIGQAVLDDLGRIGCLGMVTTHLSVLKAYAMTHDRVDNASVEFDTTTLSPTYRLRIGTPGESHAIAVADRLGLPGRIIHASRQHLNSQGRQFRRAIKVTGQLRQVAEEARARAHAAQLAAGEQQEAYQSKLADLHHLQEEFNTWLARLPELQAGDEVFVPSLGRQGRLVRLELHKQVALVDADHLQVEVPLSELIPDLGQSAVREQLSAMRQQILDQAKQTAQTAEQARRVKEEYQVSLQQQRERARQFDAWLAAIARIKTGDEVAISCKPGHGVLVSVDLPGLKAKVRTETGELELSIQDLFPQVGPFARLLKPPEPIRHRIEPVEQSAGPQVRRRQASEPQPAAQANQSAGGREPQGQTREQRTIAASAGGAVQQRPQRQIRVQVEFNRPAQRRSADGKAAHGNLSMLLAAKPGDAVYVVPFHKRATLIRLNAPKALAVVQSGIFEMEIPLTDLELIPQPRAAVPVKRPKINAVPVSRVNESQPPKSSARKAPLPQEALLSIAAADVCEDAAESSSEPSHHQAQTAAWQTDQGQYHPQVCSGVRMSHANNAWGMHLSLSG